MSSVMSLADVDVTASATVVQGALANRVQRKRVKKKPPEPKAYKRDMAIRGKPNRAVCASMPITERHALDAMAKRVQMARTDFVRQAVKHYMAHVTRAPKPEVVLVPLIFTFDELAALDDAADKARVQRSEFLRDAIAYFIAKVAP